MSAMVTCAGPNCKRMVELSQVFCSLECERTAYGFPPVHQARRLREQDLERLAAEAEAEYEDRE